MADVNPSFGTMLRAFRTRAGLTQGDLAQLSGLGGTTISELERGVRRAPQFGSAELLASALGLSPEERDAFFETVRGERVSPGPRPGLAESTPAPPGTLFGREAELAHIAGRFAEGARLVTLVGPGGSGKTRLALEHAQRVAQSGASVVWVAAETLADPGEVIPAALRATGLRGRPGASAAERLAEVLEDRDVLLVADNLEHVLDVAADLGALLDAIPSLAILATSREALRIAAETVVAVGPLPLPLPMPAPSMAAAAIAESPAVALFLDRARVPAGAPEADVAGAARVVELLDGLPLAIELAAAHSPTISPQAIAALLEQTGLRGLADGPRDPGRRFRTMEEAIRWSTGMLPPDAHELLQRLSVFRGGFELAAARALAERLGRPALASGLPRLLAANLIQETAPARGAVRFSMLEPIRLAAGETLAASGQERETRDAHASVMTDAAMVASARQLGSETGAGLAFFEGERANLLAALEHLIATRQGGNALPLANALGFWWEHVGAVREGAGWLQRAIAADDGSGPARERWLARWLAALLSLEGGDYASQRRLAGETLEIARAAADLEGEAMAELAIGMWLQTAGDDLDGSIERLDRAIALAREAIVRDGAAWLPLAYASSLRATFLYYGRGETEQPIADFEQALAIMREHGASSMQGMPLAGLAAALQASGRRDEALAAVREALEVHARFASPLVQANAAMRLASLLSEEPDRAAALRSARMLGVLEAVMARHGFQEDGMMAAENRATLRRLESALGADLDAIIAAGREDAEAAGGDPDLLPLAGGAMSGE